MDSFPRLFNCPHTGVQVKYFLCWSVSQIFCKACQALLKIRVTLSWIWLNSSYLAFYFISHNMTHSINEYRSWPPTWSQVKLYDTKSMLLTEHMFISRGFLSPNFNCSLKRRNHRSFLHLRLHLFLHLPTIIAWRLDFRLQAQRAIEYIFNHIIQTTSIMISLKQLTLFSHPPALRS